MARPPKSGLDYFPHDTDAVNDEKVEALRMLYGNDGYAFYFILLERIYRTPDGELDVSDAETIQILSRKIEVTLEKFNKMLKTALKKGCFDSEKYYNVKVLTSPGIKKRIQPVKTKRLKMKEKYKEKLVSDAETPQKPDKGKESKGKESKVILKTFLSHSEEVRLANLLWELIIKNNPFAKKPNMQSWAKEFDKILRIDMRDIVCVEQIIEACQADNFWQSNILSPKKLREKFDQLTSKLILNKPKTHIDHINESLRNFL